MSILINLLGDMSELLEKGISATDKVPKHSRIEIINVLGEGTYGEVWRAFDLKLNTEVAVKRFKELNCPRWGFSVSALREITFLKSLNHKNLSNLIDVIYEGDITSQNLLLIMELEDMNLDKWMSRKRGNIELFDCSLIINQILSGCNYLHQRHILHRDIKPDNILINQRTGCVKIADLGLARVYDCNNSDSRYSTYVQALWYRAPEILLGESSYNEKIDIWSIG